MFHGLILICMHYNYICCHFLYLIAQMFECQVSQAKNIAAAAKRAAQAAEQLAEAAAKEVRFPPLSMSESLWRDGPALSAATPFRCSCYDGEVARLWKLHHWNWQDDVDSKVQTSNFTSAVFWSGPCWPMPIRDLDSFAGGIWLRRWPSLSVNRAQEGLRV